MGGGGTSACALAVAPVKNIAHAKTIDVNNFSILRAAPTSPSDPLYRRHPALPSANLNHFGFIPDARIFAGRAQAKLADNALPGRIRHLMPPVYPLGNVPFRPQLPLNPAGPAPSSLVAIVRQAYSYVAKRPDEVAAHQERHDRTQRS